MLGVESLTRMVLLALVLAVVAMVLKGNSTEMKAREVMVGMVGTEETEEMEAMRAVGGAVGMGAVGVMEVMEVMVVTAGVDGSDLGFFTRILGRSRKPVVETEAARVPEAVAVTMAAGDTEVTALEITTRIARHLLQGPQRAPAHFLPIPPVYLAETTQINVPAAQMVVT